MESGVSVLKPTTAAKQLRIDIRRIIRRHGLSIVNLVIGTIIALLLFFGEGRDALFLSSVLTINICVGIAQEVRARLTLEKLRDKVAGKVRVVAHDTTIAEVTLDKVEPGMLIELRRGDLSPVDGVVEQSIGLEVSEAFLTGESIPLAKTKQANILAGSWVTAGRGQIRVEQVGESTRNGSLMQIARKYRVKQTPIERAIAWMISILTYTLLFSVIALSASQGWGVGSSPTDSSPAALVVQIAALTATIVPEGLVLAVTILFAYGAVQLMKRRLVVQRLSAIEMMARIQILCLDKTGTLTEGFLSFQTILAAPKQDLKSVKGILASYLIATEPEGELAAATPFATRADPAEVIKAFSSHSGYGSIRRGKGTYHIGTPESIMDKLSHHDNTWLTTQTDTMTAQEERILAIASTSGSKPKILGVVSYAQPLKKNARPVLDFFRERSVDIKIFSGDHPKTVRSIALALDLPKARTVISGEDIKKLPKAKLRAVVHENNYFARVSPEQKAELIKLCREKGIVGMVGDGANDALAIKASDVGLSMFASAEVTRSLADIVMLDNDFDQFPRAVKLADAAITTIELIGCLFLNKVTIGLVLIVTSLIAHQPYPLTPRNITVLNYFIIGVPILLWTYYPRLRQRSPHEAGFLTRILPFVLASGIIASIITIIGYILAQQGGQDLQMTTFVIVLVLGMGMLITAPRAMGVSTSPHYLRRVAGVAVASALILFALMNWEMGRVFFGLDELQAGWLLLGAGLGFIGLGLQFLSLRPHWIDRFRRLIDRH